MGAYARRAAAMRRKSPRLGEIGDEVRRHGGDDAFVRVPAGFGQQLLAVSQATEPAEDHGVPNESAVTDGDEVNVQLSSKCDIVQGSKVRRDELMSKTFKNGGCREYAAITSLLPSGSGGMHDAIPRRKDFGAEGAEMDDKIAEGTPPVEL